MPRECPLGPLIKPVVARAFAASANAVLEKQITEWDQELDQRDLVQRLAEAIEVLLGQALIRSSARSTEPAPRSSTSSAAC